MRFRVLIYLLIIFTVTLSCNETQTAKNNTQAKSEQIKAKKTVKKKKKPQKKKFPRITNKNIESFLLEYKKEYDADYALIETSKGDIKVRLFDATPLHKANFLMLARRNFYENTVWYRVEENFIIQGGDSDAYERTTVKRKIGYYDLPAEMHPNTLYHKVGALCMARDYKDNPDKWSSSYDFYIVVGSKYNDLDLDDAEKNNGFKFTEEQRNYYKTIGGAAHLDNQHTVFGQVVSGMDVVREISKVETDGQDWPKKEIYLNVKVIEN
jgi:peptidyl-prolyl cis-trans isomerase A (cyclophilin A)